MESELDRSEILPRPNEPLTSIKSFTPTAFFNSILLNDTTHTGLYNFLVTHWREYVANCYRVSDEPHGVFIQNDVDRLLFRPLEAYLCKSLTDLGVLEQLQALDNSSKICGKIFKFEEKAYFCQDCSCDITRVMCNDCFRNSKHRDHRYKVSPLGIIWSFIRICYGAIRSNLDTVKPDK